MTTAVLISRDGMRIVAERGNGPLTLVMTHGLTGHPRLIVQGVNDHYFPREHSEHVHADAVGNTRAALWVEQGMGQAGRATRQESVDRIVGRVGNELRAGA